MKDKKESGNNSSSSAKLGLTAATSIVIGNIIGSGIFMAPASFARVTNPKTAIAAWIITSIGSLLIALSFANLGSKIPKAGGPVIYTKEAFGDFAGFLVAWTYWIGSWVGNAAIITALMNYIIFFIPETSSPVVGFIISSAILWLFTLINIYGVKYVGIFGIISTVLKVAVLSAFTIIAGFNFNPSFLNTASSESVSGFSTLPAAIAIALWSFIGLESACVAGGDIENPEKNIKISTILGLIITAVIYILISIFAMGAMDQKDLALSNAPLADIINVATGKTWGGTFIALGALLSTLGAINGWLMTTARSASGAAEEGLFPESMKKMNALHNTPVTALIVSGLCTNAVLITNYVGSLQSAFDFMILLATLSFLPTYAFCTAADMLLLFKGGGKFSFTNFLKNSFLALLGFVYSIYCIYGTGAECVMYGFILLLAGIPVYVYMNLKKNYHNT